MDEDGLLARLDTALTSFESERRKTSAVNSSVGDINIKLGNGSVGIWVCVTCCLLSLLTCVFIAREVSEIRQNDRDQGHQLNAIYQYAPHLKPKDKP